MKDLFKNYYGHEVKIQLVRETMPVKEYQVRSSEDVYELVRDELTSFDREAFYVIALNSKNKILGLNLVSLGNLTSSLVHPREVFKFAILQNSASIILIHNHPSGDPNPSQDDIEITQRLKKSGDVLGIKILDHIIIGKTFFSFLDSKML
tara:strand:- start:559 stop:1008 length:450 start_codon:yes stop_codon:yes gene_type:complete